MNEEKKNIPELNCDIVRDLLPLYCDGVVSEASETAVMEHLEICEECREEKKNITSTLLTDNEWNTKSKASLIKTIKRMNKKYLLTVTAIAVVAMFVFVSVIVPFLFDMGYTTIEADEIDPIAVYPYITEDNTYFIAFLTYPEHYNNLETSWRYNRAHGKKELILEIDAVTNKFSKYFSNYFRTKYNRTFTILVFDADEMRKRINTNGFGGFDDLRDFEMIQSVSFADRIVWSKEMGTDFTVPEFIPYFIDFYYSKNNDTNVMNLKYDANAYTIKVNFKDGAFAVWSIDGNKLEDTRK